MKVTPHDRESHAGLEDAQVPRVQAAPEGSPGSSMRMVQKQLILLLHSHSCLRKNNATCKISNCQMMQDVWKHMKQCSAGPGCHHQHCFSSIKILHHWKTCGVFNCPVCHLVRIKTADQIRLQQEAEAVRNGCRGGGLIISPGQGQAFMAKAGQSTQDQNQGRASSECQGQSQQPGSDTFNLNIASNINVIHINCQNAYSTLQPREAAAYSCHRYHGLTGTSASGATGNEFVAIKRASSNSSQSLTRDFASVIGGHLKTNVISNGKRMDVRQRNIGNHSALRKNVAAAILEGMKMSISPPEMTLTEDSAACRNEEEIRRESRGPTVFDVRRAYEELGIPCPPEALERLMATLPGGSRSDQGSPDSSHLDDDFEFTRDMNSAYERDASDSD